MVVEDDEVDVVDEVGISEEEKYKWLSWPPPDFFENPSKGGDVEILVE